jgi:hypothetical protein
MNKIIDIDLQAAALGQGVILNPNLELTWLKDVRGKSALKVTPTKNMFYDEDKWLLLFDGIEFDNATIEFDALGKDEPPQSNFLGVAFHATDDSEHDAVYYRPFNFIAKDPIRRSHAVQYVSYPQYTWRNLREKHTNKFEKPVSPASSGDNWFHAKIEINKPTIKAYINNSDEPSLIVDTIQIRKAKKFGLWCGPGAGGYFSNLKVTLV